MTEVEQALKELKHDLAVRPIYHRTEERIEAHIFVAFLAKPTWQTMTLATIWTSRALKRLQAAACTYRIAFGPRAGQKVLTLRGCASHERKPLERLCRYITRPALANERVRCNVAGQVVLTLKTPWRDGTTHLVMAPLECMQRLAALVPRARLHLIRQAGKRLEKCPPDASSVD